MGGNVNGNPTDQKVINGSVDAEKTGNGKLDSKDIEKQINDLVEKMKNGEKIDESSVDPAILYAARAEKRRRDTQAAYTKAQQEAIRLKKEKEVLENLIAEELEKSLDLSKEQREELEELKAVDPDEWRKRLNEIEKEQKTLRKKKLEELKKQAAEKAAEEWEYERRLQIIEEFMEKHPEIDFTKEEILDEIPPKYIKELENNKITFEEFLQKAYNFLVATKVIKQPEIKNKPDLSKIGGNTDTVNKPLDLTQQYMTITL